MVAHVELNLTELRFVDAAGVRCLLACGREADSAGVAMTLRSPMPTVAHVLTVLDLSDRFAPAGEPADRPAPAVFHRDESSAVFHGDESSAVFHGDESPAVFHRDESSAVFHRDESPAVFHGDESEDWRQRTARIRREAQDTRRRARLAVSRSRMIRPAED
nr:STAS domain-containing protein [Actinoplanes lichenicola]